MSNTTVSPSEIARFDALAQEWWDPNGPMLPLHRMNPIRVGWITGRTGRVFRDPSAVHLLDIGCGAGLAAEAFARHGFQVTGVDAAERAIEAARTHAKDQGLPLKYRAGSAEDLLAENARFDVVTALEVIEHVSDPNAFIRTVRGLLHPGGLLFLSTLNRTPQSWLTAKVGAEYVLRWLPVGTHDWRKFLTIAELSVSLRRAGLRVCETAGLSFSPLTREWRISRDTDVNYLVYATA